jgi:hypothetical protein
MTNDDRPNAAELPPPTPADSVLEYRTPAPATRVYRPPRKPLPTPFCIGFGSASLVILFVWGNLYSNSVRHSVLIVAIGMGAVGLALCAVKELRLAGLAVLVVVSVWFLMIGGCFALGGYNRNGFDLF